MIHQFMDAKLENRSLSTEESESGSEGEVRQRMVMPNYSFVFGEHRVGESVEYEVELHESFKVFRKVVTEKYKFRTRYSMLESLSSRVGSRGFPPKKWFGNKDPEFIEERKGQLQEYLNRLAKGRSKEFFHFVLQIKEAHLEADFNKTFTLPN
jgi:hypothetical protein